MILFFGIKASWTLIGKSMSRNCFECKNCKKFDAQVKYSNVFRRKLNIFSYDGTAAAFHFILIAKFIRNGPYVIISIRGFTELNPYN